MIERTTEFDFIDLYTLRSKCRDMGVKHTRDDDDMRDSDSEGDGYDNDDIYNDYDFEADRALRAALQLELEQIEQEKQEVAAAAQRQRIVDKDQRVVKLRGRIARREQEIETLPKFKTLRRKLTREIAVAQTKLDKRIVELHTCLDLGSD